MEFLDVPTLLKAGAIFNLMAALAWLMLAQSFRIAPRASRLMAAGHVVRLLTQDCSDCLASWPAVVQRALPEYGMLACMLLLVLAVRRMLRSRRDMGDIAWVTGLGAVLVTLGLASGSALTPELASSAVATWLSLLAMREIVSGVRRQLSTTATVFMTLPFAILAAMCAAHAAELLQGAVLQDQLLRTQLTEPVRALLWLVVPLAITLSLMALMIWRVIARIQHLTFSDPLTGALNRRAFEQALLEAQAQLQRGHGFALVMIDIDHFKRINDQHGHATGDAALKHSVRIWQAVLRETDRLGRLGGEEFCALLPLASPNDLATAAAVAERLRASLNAQPLRCQGVTLAMTASFGVALPVAGDAGGEIALARADAELYRAKAEGRNRVCVALHLQPAST